MNDGNLKGALASFDEVTRLLPHHPMGHWMKGTVLCALGRSEEAAWATKAGLDLPERTGCAAQYGPHVHRNWTD